MISVGKNLGVKIAILPLMQTVGDDLFLPFEIMF